MAAAIAYFGSFDELVESEQREDMLAGKVVFVDDRMTAARTGEGYG